MPLSLSVFEKISSRLGASVESLSAYPTVQRALYARLGMCKEVVYEF